jgi:hypothetical protein
MRERKRKHCEKKIEIKKGRQEHNKEGRMFAVLD